MTLSQTRRDFLKQSAAALAGASLASAAAPTEVRPMAAEPPRIIDTHQHLWDLKQFKLPWITKDSPLNRNYLMSDYFKATEGLNIVKTIYMEVDLDPSQQQAEADFVIETCKRADNPMVAGVISGRPASDGFEK
jgi:L-fuconolactonase